MSTKDPLDKILGLYCNVNAFDLRQLSEDLREERIAKNEAALFKTQLAEAILNHTLTPEAYKKVTSDNEYNTQDELEDWLREMWEEIYGNEPIVLEKTWDP
jgi:hypothetical protein